MLEVKVKGARESFAYDFDFSADPGITALWGKSGAGKTTLLRLIAGLDQADKGVVSYSGDTWFDGARQINVTSAKRRIGYVPQRSALFAHLTVRRNLTYSNWAAGRKARVTLEEVSELLGITRLLERYPRNLSGGEKQRVALGRAMMSNPAILLLDEPFSGLDEQRIDEIAPHILALNRRIKVPILLVTHAVRDVVRLADSMIVIENGMSMDRGSLEQVLPRAGIAAGVDASVNGGLLTGKVVGYDKSYGLNQLEVAGQSLVVSGASIPRGATVRILVNASEVLVAKNSKIQTSARNHLSCNISRIVQLPENCVQLRLVCGDQNFVAKITRQALDELSLKKDGKCVAILKSVSLANQVFPR